MLKLISATYGDKNVIEILKSRLVNEQIVLNVNNQTFGDPKPGVVKTLVVNYEHNGVIGTSSIVENSVLRLPDVQTDILGIFYTNNSIKPEILKSSLDSIYKASIKNPTDILVSSWENILDSKFPTIKCSVATRNHFNIAYQICQLLATAEQTKKYKYVAFLEHDVLYGEDYFNFDDFEGNVLSNENFIGINSSGFQSKKQSDQPLHQLILKFDYALEHFKQILFESIVKGINLEPSHNPPYTQRISSQPSIHVNHGRNFTSHFNIYSKENYFNDEYWGDSKSLVEKLNLNISQ